MAQSMKGSENRINRMDMGMKCGQMGLNIKVGILMGRSKERVDLNEAMAVIMKANFWRMRFMDTACTVEMMEGSMKESRNKIKWMGEFKLFI